MAKSPFKTSPAKTVPRSHDGIEYETPGEGGGVPPAWPGELDEGSVLKGSVVKADPTGGRLKIGFIDVESESGDTFRFYVNKPAQDVLARAMKKRGLDWSSLDGSTIGIRFDSWGGKGPNKYRLFSIGIVE